jgi:hypothetical protein
MMRAAFRRWIMLAFALALLSGCSAMRLGYRQADIILAWRADDYFALDAQQKQDLRQRLDRLLYWHRYEQLPEYATFFSAAIGKTHGGLKHDDIVWFVEGIKKRYRVVVEHGVDDAADMLAAITPDQIAALQNQFDRDNRRFERQHKLHGSLDERKRARFESTISQIEDWTGSLTHEQEQRLRPLLDAIPTINHLRHQDRVRRQKEFVQLLAVRANKAEFRPRLRAWLLDWENGRSPEYEKLLGEVYEMRIQFYIAVENNLTPHQRETALHRMHGFVADMKALSEKPPASAAAKQP